MRNIPVAVPILTLISFPSSSRERKMQRIAAGSRRMGTGCSCRVWPYGQTDSFGGGKRSALDMWVQVDLVTLGEFLTVRAAGARGGATKELTHWNRNG
jgi:hypothetical protein